MSSLTILGVSAVCFVLGYFFYARRVESLFGIDPQRETPAVTKRDGVDYVPAQNWLVLFGHHFASIAGAGPIIGPALAVTLWGWGPALVWIVVGSVFFGGIHDFGALIISAKEDGRSIGDIAEHTISRRAKIILSVFTWLALMLVISVFAYFGANTFMTQPEVVLPSFGIIPVAMLTGLGLYRSRLNPALVTVLGLLAFAALILLGGKFPFPWAVKQPVWIAVLLIYCFFASIIPVNYLLQPRDYLSSFLLMGGIAAALSGILVSRPTMNAPAFIANASPVGYLWPMMFITIACGANSGFHSLVASGTTSKQLANERYAKRIGFGAMLMEGFLAVIVIIMVVGGFSLAEFNGHILAKTAPVTMYGEGFGNITSPFMGKWGTFFALTVLNVFILTTLDSATRITRYISEELFHIKNRFLSTGIVVLAGGWLALGKDSAQNPLWQKIWPAFGASNQLVAALALLVIACWLLAKGKDSRYALVPAVFMLVTSLTALVFLLIKNIRQQDVTLIVVSSALMVCAGFLAAEVFNMYRKRLFCR